MMIQNWMVFFLHSTRCVKILRAEVFFKTLNLGLAATIRRNSARQYQICENNMSKWMF